MGNDILGQVLGSVFGNAMRGRQPGGSSTDSSGGLGDVLGGMLGRGRDQDPASTGRNSPLGGSGGALIAMLLPLAMQWVQRNGGIGAVLSRMQQKGYSRQAASWMSTGPNDPLDPQAVDDVVGTEELSRLSQQLGMPREEVASGFAEIFPEMVNQLSPEGELRADADGVLDDGLSELQNLMRGLQLR